jgi:uncharacterized protein (DUF1330 family)
MDKEQLLQSARETMKAYGGKIIVRGRGNARKVSVYAADGRYCIVWFPVDARVNDSEIQDLHDAVQYMRQGG